MGTILYYIIPFAIVLGILISFHELGHFLVAKSFNVKVLKFSLGFGPRLIGKRMGETEYVISAVPLGGYVKMLGESEDEEVTGEDIHRSFYGQSVPKRIAIAAAGPVFNFFLAFILFCFIYLLSGYPVLKPVVGQVRPESPAEMAGIKKGDIIQYINGVNIEKWMDIREFVRNSPGKVLEIQILRGDKTLVKKVFPEEELIKNIFGEEIKSHLIGIVPLGEVNRLKLGLFRSIGKAGEKTWEIISLTVLTIIKLFQGVVSLKTLGGPIMIGQMTGDIARENVTYLLPFTALISVNLAIINLFPIPVLDGGMILFFLIEGLIRRPVSIKKRELAQKIGFFVLLVLISIVMYNDISRIDFGDLFNFFQGLFGD